MDMEEVKKICEFFKASYFSASSYHGNYNYIKNPSIHYFLDKYRLQLLSDLVESLSADEAIQMFTMFTQDPRTSQKFVNDFLNTLGHMPAEWIEKVRESCYR